MSFFTSDRERRLWLWTLAVVVATYSTLSLTKTLAGALLPSRVFDPRGLLFNVLASVMAILANLALARVRRRVGRAHTD